MMIQSMTGYGAAEKDGFKVEVRSLNHKYIDIAVKMPSALMAHDAPIRNLIKAGFKRGKFDVSVSFADKRQMKVSINRELTREIYDAFLDLQKELAIPGALTIDFFSGYRELLLAEEPEYDPAALYEAFNHSLERLKEMRDNEGATLEKELLGRLDKLEKARSAIERLSKGLTHKYKETLSRRIAELAAGVAVDETRLAQEVAIIAQKSDIAEETARLESHISQFRSSLSGGDAVGRRLDFILQEMHREVNTIASKMDDIGIINLTIEARSELEKLREQVQNIQ